MTRSFARILLCALSVPLLACVAGSEPTAESESTKSADDPVVTVIDHRTCTTPVPSGATCGPLWTDLHHVACIVEGAWDDPEPASLGCCPPFQYYDAIKNSFHETSLCPDTGAVRAAVAARYPFAQEEPELCTPCLPAAPPGKVWVYWTITVGPGCPSGCGYVPGTYGLP